MSGAFIGMSIDTSIRLDVYRSEGCHHRRNGSPLLLMVFTQRCSTLRVYLTVYSIRIVLHPKTTKSNEKTSNEKTS